MKPYMKVLGLVVLVAIGVIAAVAYGIGGSSSTSTTSTTTSTTAAATTADAAAEDSGPAYLYSFYGTDATVKRVTGSKVAYDVSIPVDAANAGVTWFTDRPNRDAGTMSYEAFASLWTKPGADSFSVDPPNVSIIFGSGLRKPKAAIAKMSNTKIVDNPNGNGQLLLATMTVETGQEAAALANVDGFVAAQAKNSTILKTITNADAKHFAVFIDDYKAANGCVYTNDWCTNHANAPGDAMWGTCERGQGKWSNYPGGVNSAPGAITCLDPRYYPGRSVGFGGDDDWD